MGNGGSSMITEHTAIFKLYPNVVTIRDNGKDNYICKDEDGNLVVTWPTPPIWPANVV